MAVVVEPTVSFEKLSSVLAEGTESEAVDFKREHNSSSRHDVVVLAKEAGAMQMLESGGYVVLGAADDGTPSGLLTDEHAIQLDEASVRAQLLRYLFEPLDLLVAVHRVDNRNVCLVYIGPSRDCFAIFRADGGYQADDGSTRFKFRAGEVFARHGTASERWNHQDIERVRRRIRAQEKEAWREELRSELAHFGVGQEAQTLAAGPASNLSWELDLEAFIAVVIELVRHGDDIPVRLLLNGLPSRVEELMWSGGEEALADVLDRCTCLLATFLSIQRDEYFDDALNAVVASYMRGFDQHGVARQDTAISAARLWLMITERVLAVGGFAVRAQRWQQVRQLVLQRGTGYDFEHYTNWLRHGLTMAARASLFVEEADGQRRERSLIELAHNHVRRLAWLRPDAPPEADEILTSLVQFDVLAAIISVDNAGSVDGTHFYTNFARFYSTRSTPVVRRLIEDEALRKIAFPRGDDDLAITINEISRRANAEGWRFDGFTGFGDDVVTKFVEEHLPESPPPPA